MRLQPGCMRLQVRLLAERSDLDLNLDLTADGIPLGISDEISAFEARLWQAYAYTYACAYTCACACACACSTMTKAVSLTNNP